MLAANHERRRPDPRQPLLDPVREREDRLSGELRRPVDEVVADHGRAQTRRFVPGVDCEPEEVANGASRLWIDRRTDEDERFDELGPFDCEGRCHLATHRVRDQHGRAVEPIAQPPGELGNRLRLAQLGAEHVADEHLRERLEISLADTETVNEAEHPRTVTLRSSRGLPDLDAGA